VPGLWARRDVIHLIEPEIAPSARPAISDADGTRAAS
jgi:hypothetical protein